MNGMTIAGLARTGGVGVETVRYYQRRGLLDTPARTAGSGLGGGIRRYGHEDVRRLRFIAVGIRRRFDGLGCVRRWLRPGFVCGHCRDRRLSSSWPFAWTHVFTEYLVTEHRDGGLARRQAMLREQIGDGAIRRALLSQFRDDILRRHQVLELLWTPRREFFDRLANCGWVK